LNSEVQSSGFRLLFWSKLKLELALPEKWFLT
jgi:hypothetical protein